MTIHEDLQTRILIAMTVERKFQLWTPGDLCRKLYGGTNDSLHPEYRPVIRALGELVKLGKVEGRAFRGTNQSVYWAKHFIRE